MLKRLSVVLAVLVTALFLQFLQNKVLVGDQDLQAEIRASGEASGGLRTSFHLYSELFNKAAGVSLTHVPYNSELVAALLSNQVQMLITAINTALPQLKAGKVKALAVTTDGKRVPALPDVPSMAVAGLPGMAVYGWHGLVGPGGMPRELAQAVQREVARAIAAPAIREKFQQQAGEAVGNPPEEFAAFVRAQAQRWGEVIQAAGIAREQ